MDREAEGERLTELLGLRWAPVALAFRASAPEGVKRVSAAAPSGCTYWRLAAEGGVFYTEAEDHYNCPIGAHTHGVDLPPAQAKELEGLVKTMVSLEYLRMEEVPAIPRRSAPFGVAVYAPLAAAPFAPDVVILRGNARQAMLFAEAAAAAGAAGDSSLLGRPTCAMVPEALRASRAVISLGCIGNRVYADLADDEMYFACPGPKVGAVVERLATVARANRELEAFHRARRAAAVG